MTQQARIDHWQRMTGLLPPDLRGFVPRRDGDEVPARGFRGRSSCVATTEPSPRPKWGVASIPEEAGPSWHNVVRAYEEDR